MHLPLAESDFKWADAWMCVSKGWTVITFRCKCSFVHKTVEIN